MILKLKSAETNLGTASDVSTASVVRVYNSDTADHVIVNSNGTTVTLPGGAITFIDKLPTETLNASNTSVLAVSVAYSTS